MAGVVNTFSTQLTPTWSGSHVITSMAAPINCDRTAVNTGKRDAYTVSRAVQTEAERAFCVPDGSSGSRDHSFELTPHPAYGSELSTGGGRLVRALTAMEPARHPFPVSSTARTIGEQKAKVKEFSRFSGLASEANLWRNANDRTSLDPRVNLFDD